MKDTIKLLKSYVSDKEENIYIVGKYIREKLKDPTKEPEDIEIAFKGEESKLIEFLQIHGFKFNKLDYKNVGYRETEELAKIHILNINGKSIEEYLQERDFTVNAIALSLNDNKIIDPYNGRRDIKSKLVTEVLQDSIQKKTIRILSAIRLVVENGMHFSGFTEEHIRLYKNKLKECNKVELHEEILGIISKDKDGNAIDYLDRFEILEKIFPYIKESKSVGRCKYHIVDAYTHMEITYRTFKDLVAGRLDLKGIKEILVDKPIGEFFIYDYIAIAAFLHDIGKFSSYKKENGKVSFEKHNEFGARITEEALTQLGFPKEATELITTIVEGHMHPLKIFKKGGLKEENSINQFFNKYKEVTPMILAVSYSDVYATLSLKDDDNQGEAYKSFIENLIEKYRVNR